TFRAVRKSRQAARGGGLQMTNARRAFFASVGAFSVIALSSATLAQEAPKPADDQPPQSAQPADQQTTPGEKKVERVVVTGSRLKKNEFTSSAPIQIITREEST